MKTAIGSIPLLNIIIIFIVITFAFLSATLSYMRAFKVNSNIAKQLEKYEGYNSLASEEIDKALLSLGYRMGSPSSCPVKEGTEIKGSNFSYCLYESNVKNGYYNYGIVTFIYLDIPIIAETLKIPVYTETERIFKFSS